ncbi:hypothetical protein ACMD2_18162, partial [Ananas comosus]
MERCWASDPARRPSFSEISQKLRKMAAAINELLQSIKNLWLLSGTDNLPTNDSKSWFDRNRIKKFLNALNLLDIPEYPSASKISLTSFLPVQTGTAAAAAVGEQQSAAITANGHDSSSSNLVISKVKSFAIFRILDAPVAVNHTNLTYL